MNTPDERLGEKYGPYASFSSPADPIAVDTHGDSAADEVDRLLSRLTDSKDVCVLDLGCGAGLSLCRIARNCKEIWGIDLNEELLDRARERAGENALANVRFVLGDTTNADAVAQLPDNHFDVAFSLRGPFVNSMLMPKLKERAHVVIELFQDILGLKELLGRTPIIAGSKFAPTEWCVNHHVSIGLQPVSVKDYFFEQYFRDVDHLIAFLSLGASLSNWWMDPNPYDEARDRQAIEVFAHYNTTHRGIRLIQHRKVYLFRRSDAKYYPADGIPPSAA